MRLLSDQRRSVAVHSPSVRQTAGVARGFTLIEILVALAIFVILLGIVLSSLQLSPKDKIAAGARTVQSAFLGAKSRAVRDKALRGVRLVVDSDDPRVVTSLQYIEQGQTEELQTFDMVDHVGPTVSLSTGGAPANWTIPAGTAVGYYVCIEAPRANALRRGLPAMPTATDIARQLSEPLNVGARLEVPSGSGNWYTLRSFEDEDGDNFLDPGEDLNGNMTLDFFYSLPAVGAGPVRAFLRLQHFDPDAIPLAELVNATVTLQAIPTPMSGEGPVLLPAGVAIDLDGSLIPNVWRPIDADGDGVPEVPYSSTMDIMFTPSGTTTGGGANYAVVPAVGLLHLYLATTADIAQHEALGTAPNNRPVNIRPANTAPLPVVPADPEDDHRMVSVFVQTGLVVISQVDVGAAPDYTDGPHNDVAPTPFSYAVRGREAAK